MTNKNESRKNLIRIKVCLLFLVGIFCISGLFSLTTYAAAATDSTIGNTSVETTDAAADVGGITDLTVDGNTLSLSLDNGTGEIAGTLRILITLTLIALVPTFAICVTSFTRIIIVLHFTRSALNTQTSPPNQVLIGLALFLTFFIMSPVITQINEEAVKPFDAGEITQQEAFEIGMDPIREFMYGQTQTKDVKMFLEISNVEWDGSLDGIPTSVLVPSFMISELRTAFIIGFLIYIPFIIIDMVVASTLMSMGMMMLPPTTISMPFKILLFILADGWNLVIGSLVKTFY